MAFENDIKQVAYHQTNALLADTTVHEQEIVQIEAATPKAMVFIEALMGTSC